MVGNLRQGAVLGIKRIFMAVKPVLVPSSASQDNVTKGRSNTKEDVSGRSDVQNAAKFDDSIEVDTLNDLVNALNQVNSRSSVYGDKPVTLGGKNVTSVSYDDKGLKLGTKK